MAIQVQVVMDAADPAAQAEFWARALDYVVQPPPPGFASWDDFADKIGLPLERRGDQSAVVDPAGRGPRVYFQRVPEGKQVKNRCTRTTTSPADAWSCRTRRATSSALPDRALTGGRQTSTTIGMSMGRRR
jgi:hypothetical protein